VSNFRRAVQSVFAALVSLHLHAGAQIQPAPQAESDLRGAWLVVIEGENETRTLIIAEVAATGAGALLAAKYGMTKGGQSPIEAKLGRVGESRQMNLVTQAVAVVTAVEQADGSFKGTFTRKNGVASNVTISRTSLQTAAESQPKKDLSVIVPLAADVPPECAAFHGVWSRTWSQGGITKQFLRVVDVTRKEGKCAVRLSYSSSETPMPATAVVELDGNVLSFVCNRSTGGTCSFKRVSDDLWGTYSNAGGGTNSGVFRRASQ
jgi:hypothetical protein